VFPSVFFDTVGWATEMAPGPYNSHASYPRRVSLCAGFPMTKLFLFAVCHYVVFVAYTLSVILVYFVKMGSRPSRFQCCCMVLCVGCALGANAYWSTAFHIYTPLPFRPGRGFGDLFRTHFFVNAGNLNTVKFGKLRSDMVDYAQ